jgi:hypothetical protein
MKNKQKDAYYFPHDSNARHDPDCIKLRRILGSSGYGIYWMIIESLRDTAGYKLPLTSVKELSFDFRESEEMILSIITDFNLFQISDNHFFWSESLNRRMAIFDATRRAQSLGGKKGRQKQLQLGLDDDSQGTPEVTPGMKVNQSKLNESKTFKKPTVDEIKEYCNERKNNVDADNFFDFYESKGWMIGRNKMKDWHAAVRTWERSETSKEDSTTSKLPKPKEFEGY